MTPFILILCILPLTSASPVRRLSVFGRVQCCYRSAYLKREKKVGQARSVEQNIFPKSKTQKPKANPPEPNENPPKPDAPRTQYPQSPMNAISDRINSPISPFQSQDIQQQTHAKSVAFNPLVAPRSRLQTIVAHTTAPRPSQRPTIRPSSSPPSSWRMHSRFH